MITVFVDELDDDLARIEDKGEIKHIINVMRLKVGDKLRLLFENKAYIGEIESISKAAIEVGKLLKESLERESEVEIDVALGMLKSDKMDMVIQKLTELGVNRIIPIEYKRSVVRLKEKKERWDKISREALKQCQGTKKVKIEEPVKVKKIDISNYDKVFLPYEKAEYGKLRLSGEEKKVLYFIGPEGGIEEEEIEHLKSLGAKTITLGKRILRAETAAIVVGGVLFNELH